MGKTNEPPSPHGFTYGTAVCGPACTVVWQGRAGDRSPYADRFATGPDQQREPIPHPLRYASGFGMTPCGGRAVIKFHPIDTCYPCQKPHSVLERTQFASPFLDITL